MPSRVVHLTDVAARLGAARVAHVGEAHGGQFRIGQALLAEVRAEAGEQFGVVAVGDPLRAHVGQALAHVDGHVRIGVGAGGVVDQHRRVLFAAEVGGGVAQRDLAHRHADVRARTLDVDLARIGQGLDGLLVDPGAFAQVLVFGCAHRRGSPRHAAGNVGANLKQESPAARRGHLVPYAGTNPIRFNGIRYAPISACGSRHPDKKPDKSNRGLRAGPVFRMSAAARQTRPAIDPAAAAS